jgi:signal transduction histidine kinase/CheY-like chemotaxis protein
MRVLPTSRRIFVPALTVSRPMSVVLASILLILSAARVIAEAPVEIRDQDWRLTSFVDDAGFNRQSINALEFERDGTVWIGTSSGLYRYDGYQWTRFSKEHGLPSQMIRSLARDADGRLWVGTDSGVGVWDGARFDVAGSTGRLAGPTVRRITTTADGSVWFSSDHFPSQQPSAGLTRKHGSEWTVWASTNGLPNDTVLSFFEDSRRWRYALTDGGVVRDQGRGWQRIPELGATKLWTIAETTNGVLVAMTHDTLWTADTTNGWRAAGPAPEGLSRQFSRTRDGHVFTFLNSLADGASFVRWNGSQFEAWSGVSSGFRYRPRSWIEAVVESPDGSLWAGGNGLLLRWERDGGEWRQFSRLYNALTTDRDGRAWLVGVGQAVTWTTNGFEYPGYGPFIAYNHRRDLWAWDAEWLRTPGNRERLVSLRALGIRWFHRSAPDHRERMWFTAELTNGLPAAVMDDGIRTVVFPMPLEAGTKISTPAGAKDGSVWYGFWRGQRRGMLRLHEGRWEEIPLPGNDHEFFETWPVTDGTGQICTFGASNPWKWEGGAWIRLPAPNARLVAGATRFGSSLLALLDGGAGGTDGFAVLENGAWRDFPAEGSGAWTQEPDGHVLIGSRRGLVIVPPHDAAASRQLTLPPTLVVLRPMLGAQGQIWISSPHGVWHYQPDRLPPRMRSIETDSEISEGGRLRISAVTVERFKPAGSPGQFRYSWRVDGGPWSPFHTLPKDGLPMTNLASGNHQIEIRAQDEGLDVEPEATRRQFIVRATPLETRPWFKVAVAATGVLLAGLVAVTLFQKRQLFRHSRQLEATVNERTRELESAISIAEAERVSAQTAQRAAEAASRAKGQFLATMSHEIRTPMNGVLGFTHLLNDTPLDGTQREYVRTIRQSAESLLSLIHDILDFSKIEAGKVQLERTEFDLAEVLESSLELLAERARAKNLELACLLPPDVPTRLVGDPGRLRQIILNLLSNALKFTQHGEVVIEVRLTGRPGAAPDAPPEVEIAVRDTGIGIAADVCERLFQPFSQADGSMARRFGGTGLGLAISRQIAGLLDGTMGVESHPGRGSRFWFTLRMPPAPVREIARVPDARRILVVDDSTTALQAAVHAFTSIGVYASACRSLAELVATLARDRAFDAVLVDANLAGTDGLAAGQALRDAGILSPPQLILVIPVGHVPSRESLLLSGFSGSIAKPLRRAALRDLFDTAAETQTPSSHRSAAPEKPLEGLHVLLAEDNPVNQRLAVRLLEKLGASPEVAANGLEALEAAGRVRFDIVFMDCQMPEMDGLEATRRLRERPERYGRPAIVAVTANAMAGDQELCVAAGMDEYVTKPLRTDALIGAIQRALAKTSAASSKG